MATPVSGNSYYILSYGGTLTLDLSGGSSADGTQCLGWSPHFDQLAKNRVWTLQDTGAGWKAINVMSGTALTLKNGAADDGTAVVGSNPFESPSQLWSFEPQEVSAQTTSYVIRNKASNTVMDLSNGGPGDGTHIVGYHAQNSWNQRWIFVPVNN